MLNLLILLFGVRVFNLQFLQSFKPTNTILISLSIFPFLVSFFSCKKRYLFQKEISKIFVFCLVTMVVCWLSRGQTVLESFPLYVEISTLGLYVLFISIDLDLSKMHLILLVMAIVASVLYIVQFYLYPMPICLSPDNIDELMKDTTNSRFRMYGQSLVSLGLVLGYVKYLQEKSFFIFL